MQIQTLKNFLVIAEEGNITNASHILHISQSTLSRQMIELEQELDTQLFIRTNRQTVLTFDGVRFRNKAKELVDTHDSLLYQFQNHTKQISGEIRIGCFEVSMPAFICDVIVALQSKYPDIKFSFSKCSESELSYYFDENMIDFAICTDFTNQNQYQSIPFENLISYGILYNRNNIHLQSTDAVSFAELRNLSLVVPAGYTNPNYPKKIAISRSSLSIKGTYDSLSLTIPLITNQPYAALCSNITTDPFINDTVIFSPFEQQENHNLFIIWKKHRLLSNASQCFLDEFNQK